MGEAAAESDLLLREDEAPSGCERQCKSEIFVSVGKRRFLV